MRYKTKLPSLEKASSEIQKKLFEIGYTWKGGDTSIFSRLQNCHLILHTDTREFSYIGSGSLNEMDFFKYPATFIQWYRLIQNEVVIQEYAEDIQLYNNMVYYNLEGWKHDL